MAEHQDATERAEAAPDVDRRRFLQAGLTGTGAIVAASLMHSYAAAAANPLAMTNTGPDQIPRKPLGRTGEQVSIIGLGGYHLGTLRAFDDAVRIVQEAVDAGMTFLDNAWEYHERRERGLDGQGAQGRRDQVFLMTKVCTHGRDEQGRDAAARGIAEAAADRPPRPLADPRGHLR